MRLGRLLILCCLTSPWLLTATSSRHEPFRPNVFLITIDTLRADHVGCYGDRDIQTPALDGLAHDGILFKQAYTPSPITNSSHTTILTGLLPSSHGVTDFAVPLASTHATWAELLKAKGYHTAAFIGAVILDSKSLAPGLQRGFDYYDNFPEHPNPEARWGRVERRGLTVVHRAENWLTAHPPRPHFVWLHLYDPHDPYEPPSPFSQIYKDRLYDGEIAYADSALADFLTFLKRHSLYENSVIIAVADHGEGLGEHVENTHGIFLYDSTTHVPLIIKLPGDANSGKVVSAQVRTTDIMPTVIDLLGIPAPAELDGESLQSYFDGGDESGRVAFGETDYPLRFGWAPLRSVRTEGFKFIKAPRPELYDLRKDPGELQNGYVPSDPTAQRLQAMVEALRSRAQSTDASAVGPSQEIAEKLRASGDTGNPAAVASAETAKQSLPDPKDKIQEANLLHTAMLASDDHRPVDARAALESVLQLDPESPTALRQLGELEVNTGDYQSAAAHLHKVRAARPNDLTAAFLEGQARVNMNDLLGARDALESSLKLAPQQLSARLLLANVYLLLKNPTAAQDQYEAASLLDPNSLEAQVGVARSKIAEGHAADSLDELKQLATSHADNSEIFELLAQAYKSVGNQKAAQEAENHARSLRGKKKASN